MRQLKINTSITVRNDGLLEKYLNEISRIPMITTEEEVEHLFKIINMLRDKGVGIIYISHKMAEINRSKTIPESRCATL